MTKDAYLSGVLPFDTTEPTQFGPYDRSILDRAISLTDTLGRFGVSELIQADIRLDLQDGNVNDFVKRAVGFSAQESPQTYRDALNESLTPDIRLQLGPGAPVRIVREWGLSTTMLSILLLPRYARVNRGMFYHDWLQQIGLVPGLGADAKSKLENTVFYQGNIEVPRLLGGMSLHLLDEQLQQTGKGLDEGLRQDVTRRVAAHYRAKAVAAANTKLVDEQLGGLVALGLPVVEINDIIQYNRLLRLRI